MVPTKNKVFYLYAVFSVRIGSFAGGVVCEGQTIVKAPPYLYKQWMGKNIIDLARYCKARKGSVAMV